MHKRSSWTFIAIALFGSLAVAQPPTPSPVIPATLTFTFKQSSGPILVAPGEHLLLCGANTGATSITVTLEFLNGVTGAVLSSQKITLPPLGATTSVAEPPDPCLEYAYMPFPTTGPAAATRTLFIAAVSVSAQPAAIFRGGLATSLQVFTPANALPGAPPTNIRTIPLLPSDPCAVFPVL